MKSFHQLYILFVLVLLLTGTATAGSGDIVIIPVSDAIGPGISDFISAGIQQADDEKAACVIIELDTPGGLADAMREIVMSIYAAKIPVIVYVSPSGARAASLSTRSSFSA